jgi:hypothetical protein
MGVANLQNVAGGSSNFITGLFNANAMSNGSNNNLYGGLSAGQLRQLLRQYGLRDSVGTYLTTASRNTASGTKSSVILRRSRRWMSWPLVIKLIT